MSTAVAQKTPSESPAKLKREKQKKKAAPPAHPLFKQMIIEAIKHINDPNGASRKAIRKVIEDKYTPKNSATFLNKNLAKMVAAGKLKHPKKFPGKYVITTEKAEKKPRSPKKKAAKKPKSKTTIKKGAQERKKKLPAKKLKSSKKTPTKKVQPKKMRGPPTPKKAGATEKKKGRGRPKKK